MSVRVGVGISNFPFSSSKAFWRFVELCEGSAVDSLWQTDRLASPTPFLEAMSVMAALAGATERIKFGMNAVVVPFRDPFVLAKQCGTIDFLSGGRLLPVFGVGANTAPEWRATGRSPKGRGARADEALELMARLWSEERVSFEGNYFQYREASIAPRPVQRPLPLWIGGSSEAAIRRTARIGTGWLAGLQTPAQVAPVVRAIQKATAQAGRSIEPDHYGATFLFRFGSWDEPVVERVTGGLARRANLPGARALVAVGSAADVIARAREYREAGVSKFVLIPLAESDDEILEQTLRLVDEVLPVVHEWS